MQGKTISATTDEIRKVTNNWTAEAESRGTSVSSSTWSVTGSLTLGTEALSGSVATALVTVDGCGEVSNVVMLANGEVLELCRKIEV